MTKLHDKTTRKCPKCKSRFGVILAKNIYKGKSQVLCFNGDCDWKTSITEWNDTYRRSQFKDPGYMSVGQETIREAKEKLSEYKIEVLYPDGKLEKAVAMSHIKLLESLMETKTVTK